MTHILKIIAAGCLLLMLLTAYSVVRLLHAPRPAAAPPPPPSAVELWLGHPMVVNLLPDGKYDQQISVNIQIGLRADGLVAWRKVEQVKK